MVHKQNLVQPGLKVQGQATEEEPVEQQGSKLCLVLS